jgi:hypothetical protein
MKSSSNELDPESLLSCATLFLPFPPFRTLLLQVNRQHAGVAPMVHAGRAAVALPPTPVTFCTPWVHDLRSPDPSMREMQLWLPPIASESNWCSKAPGASFLVESSKPKRTLVSETGPRTASVVAAAGGTR